ncbi:unannotated protein [freshwater metagenome]|uniref:Unannotated protein n=1 Tax=freshwater metagenome TaxID=449393 RepID=A0A6J7JK70_9ZZZZ|nr:NAD(P)/FAD-dependent oxidoreductase [Actinomycetota bacterium]
MVVALGAALFPQATPGLLEGGHEFYTNAGAFAAREVLETFAGGNVVIGVASAPYKCVPAPSETAMLVHDLLKERGLLDRSTVTLLLPLPRPVPPAPDASAAILAAFAERGIAFRPDSPVASLDPERKVVVVGDGEEIPYDLFLGVPVHAAPAVLQDAGMCVDGYVPVDPLTMETQFPGVYAVGDVAATGTPKAGVFSEGQAIVAAQRIIATLRGEEPSAEYDGRGTCYVEFGHDEVARIDIRFAAGEPPTGSLVGPSPEVTQDKAEFGRSRVKRWFGRDWTGV